MRKGQTKNIGGGYTVRQVKQFRGRQVKLPDGFELLKNGVVVETGVSYSRCCEIAFRDAREPQCKP